MPEDSLAFIGGGNMARALIGGLLAAGRAPGTLRVSDPLGEVRRRLQADFPGIAVVADNAEAAHGAPTWVLAVKPQHMREVARHLARLAQDQRPLVVSIAAGIRAGRLAAWLGEGVPVVRSMPNRPALLGCGISALFADAAVTPEQRARAAAVLAAVGESLWVEDEDLMDAVTAVSGSGPAYVFLLVEMLEAAARAEGLDASAARRLAVETVHGAARMARELEEDPATLRGQVTSPGGTTAAALEVLERAGIRATFAAAVRAGTLRSRQLADENGN